MLCTFCGEPYAFVVRLSDKLRQEGFISSRRLKMHGDMPRRSWVSPDDVAGAGGNVSTPDRPTSEVGAWLDETRGEWANDVEQGF